MALIGALVAACTALLSNAHNALIGTKVQQSNVAGEFQSASTKYRVTLSSLQQLHALLPEDPALDVKFKAVADGAEKAVVDRAMGQLIRAETGRIASLVSPSSGDALRMVNLARTYKHERDVTRTWLRSYDAEIAAHYHASHRIEYAFLCVELAIVFCSIALLLHSRKMWLGAVIVAAIGAVFAGIVGLGYWSALHTAEQQVAAAEASFRALDKSARASDDEALLTDIERAYAKPRP